MSYLTLGCWDEEQDAFDVSAKIRDPQLERPILVISAPQTEREVRNCLRVLQAKGLLKFQDDHYVVTPEGERYRDALKRSLLGTQQMEDEQL